MLAAMTVETVEMLGGIEETTGPTRRLFEGSTRARPHMGDRPVQRMGHCTLVRESHRCEVSSWFLGVLRAPTDGKCPAPVKPPTPASNPEHPPSATNITHADPWKVLTDRLSEQVVATGTRDRAIHTIKQAKQKQERLAMGLSETASENKLYRDRIRMAKLECDSASRKADELGKQTSSSLSKLVQHVVDKTDKKNPAVTPIITPEQEGNMLKKFQETLQKQVESMVSDKSEAIQQMFDKVVADLKLEFEGKLQQHLEKQQEQTAAFRQELKEVLKQELKQELNQELRQDIKKELRQEVSGEYNQKFETLKDNHSKEVGALKDFFTQETNSFKEQCNQELNSLRQKNQELQNESRDELQRFKAGASAEKVALKSHFEQQVAALQASIPTAQELQSLRAQANEPSTDISSLPAAIANMETQNKAAVHDLDQLRIKAEGLEYQLSQLQQGGSAQKHPQSRNSSVDTLNEQHPVVAGMQISIADLERDVRRMLISNLGTTEKIENLEKRFDQERGGAGSASAHGTPVRESGVQQTDDGGSAKKNMKKELKKLESRLQDWTMSLMEKYSQDLNLHSTQIGDLQKDIAALRTMCDETNEDRAKHAATVGQLEATVKTSTTKVDELDNKWSPLDAKVETLNARLDKQITDTRHVFADFELRITSVHQNQNSWRSQEFANFIIRQVHASTPGTLQHSLNYVNGRVDDMDQRVQFLEGESTKRRKMPNSSPMAVNNGQQFSTAASPPLTAVPTQGSGPHANGDQIHMQYLQPLRQG